VAAVGDKLYTGRRSGTDGTSILVTDLGVGEYPLPFTDKHEHERLFYGTTIPTADTPDSRRHEWGYEGTGPADTAASILADWYGTPQPGRIVQHFKRDCLAGLPREPGTSWSIDEGYLRQWADRNQDLFTACWAEVPDRPASDPAHEEAPDA
jgi:hypothetical protein